MAAGGPPSPVEETIYDFGIISAEEDNDEVTFFIEILRHSLSGRHLLFSSRAPGNDNEETDKLMELMFITLTRSQVILFFVTENFTKSGFAQFFTEHKFLQEMDEGFQRRTMVLALCPKSVHKHLMKENYVMQFLSGYIDHDISFLRTKFLDGFMEGDDIEIYINDIPQKAKAHHRALERFVKKVNKILPLASAQLTPSESFPPQEPSLFPLPVQEGDVTVDGPAPISAIPSSQQQRTHTEGNVQTLRTSEAQSPNIKAGDCGNTQSVLLSAGAKLDLNSVTAGTDLLSVKGKADSKVPLVLDPCPVQQPEGKSFPPAPPHDLSKQGHVQLEKQTDYLDGDASANRDLCETPDDCSSDMPTESDPLVIQPQQKDGTRCLVATSATQGQTQVLTGDELHRFTFISSKMTDLEISPAFSTSLTEVKEVDPVGSQASLPPTATENSEINYLSESHS